jgi:hypothetical protein
VTIPAGLFKANMVFDLGGVEVAMFSTNWHFTGGVMTDTTIAAIARQIKNNFVTGFSTLQPKFCTNLVPRTMQLYQIDNAPGPTHGKTLFKTEYPFTGTDKSSCTGTATACVPWECSVAVSLAAYAPAEYVSKPGRHRGRFYLPPFASGLLQGLNGYIAAAHAQDIASAMHTWIEGANDAVPQENGQLECVIWSRADDAIYRVEHLWVDQKVDSQRRRQNKETGAFRQVQTLQP